MRTLSANIAVEMPESEVNSTHYRVLFLAALVLFLFTFFFNTVAEVVRQRLRRKYSLYKASTAEVVKHGKFKAGSVPARPGCG